MATENYHDKPLIFKIRKVLRYIALYGFSRTLIKVRGQYHMSAKNGFDGTTWRNPNCRATNTSSRTIGILGAGSFAFSNIAYYLAKEDKCFLRGVMDADPARARSLVSHFKGAYATTDPEAIIGDPNIDLIYIASNHASHAPYAIDAIRAGKHVHIEKPHVVTSKQLSDLKSAMHDNPTVKVFLGFNRPRSRLFARLNEALCRESGPLMINWFVAGHEIDGEHWYFKESEGGRILGNLCHWSDLTLEMLPKTSRFPCRIVPTSARNAKSDFITSIEFADGSLATITFSAKGHTFDGVREFLNVHKGDLLGEIRDFEQVRLTRNETRTFIKAWHRDHGHRANIVNSLRTVRGKIPDTTDREYIIDTARFFLAIKEAHETQKPIMVD